jgi:hypothetical protein
MMQCSFGVAPSSLIVIPKNMVNAGNMPAATIMDNIPFTNIPPFSMCNAPTNPTFIAATAAKLGVPTPVPCVPVTVAPWIPGGSPTVMIGKMPAINVNATLMCTWAGVIKITTPSQFTVMVP